ncbi:hypothetical protein ACFX15_006803 [Malus domestica]|uniref:zinc finger CCCH domain-containing protein 53-like isoform X2 n=1 Tax=Malus domestica TaxID=3750 RepID=UPI0039761563
MESYEATKIVFSRIQSLDPENASKIMGYLLLQEHGDKEMIRLAFGPETLLHNLLLNAKTQLSLLPANSPASTCTPTTATFTPISRPTPLSLSSSSSSSSPSSSSSSTLWSLSNPISPSSASSPSYANILTRNTNPTSLSASSSEVVDKYQFQSNLSLLSDPKANDLFYGAEDLSSWGGWKPCLYYSRGFCKNGSACRFLHGGSASTDGGSSVNVDSPSNANVLEQCHEIIRSNAAAQQQKLAALSHFMADGGGAGASSFPYNKCMNFLMQQQNESPRSAASVLMTGDEIQKFGRYQHDRNDFSPFNLGGNVNHSSRQIYLTFPADSTFREEDVSNYFSIYGPVQDVRIPYQQKRMFGFVTFVYSETVRNILAKGNPHFVCDSRVLVKPYKEKGKIPDKKQQHQQFENEDHHLCRSLSAIDSRERYDLNLGSRMFYNTEDMLLRRKIEEQANLHQAIEIQERRLMNLRLLGIKTNNLHHQNQYYNGLPQGSPFPSPTLAHASKNQSLNFSPKDSNEEFTQEYEAEKLQQEMNPAFYHGNEDNNGNDFKLHESMEHNLPDSLFASPKKSAAGDQINVFSTTASAQVNTECSRATTISSSNNTNTNNNNNNNNNLLPTTFTPNADSPKSVLSKCAGFLLECN